MTDKAKRNALIFYNRLTKSNRTELDSIAIEFVSHIDEIAIKKTLVLTDTSGGSYTAIGLKYGATKHQVRHWLNNNKKAATN